MPGFSDFAGFAGVVEITGLNTSEFLYYLDELYAYELVFVFSFVSSNNTDVETTEQFIQLHTRYVCDFSGLTNFSQKLWNSKKTFVSYLVYFFGFLAFDPRWILWYLPRKEVSPWDSGLLIWKISYRTVYPEKLFPWPPVCLLSSEKVVSFFICEACWISFFAFGMSWRLIK